MKPLYAWTLLASALLGSSVFVVAEDEPKKSETKQSDELFKKLDKNDDGKLVPDEISDDQGRFFDRLVRLGDKDDNGELTKAEFQAALQRSDQPVQGGGLDRRPGQGGPGDRPMIDPKQMFERLDKNKDGKLTKDELPEEGPGRFLREMLTRIGKDSLTVEDIERGRQRLAQAGGANGRPNLEEMFKRMDANGDGKVTLEEVPEPFRDRVKPMFEKAGKKELMLGDVLAFAPRPEGERRPEADRKEGERREGDKKEGERRPEGGPRPDGRRPDGDRPPEGNPRRDGGRNPDGDRRPEMRRDGEGQDRPPMPRFFQILDHNKDGRISRDELDRLRDLFQELDRNKDGQLDPAELMGPPPDGRGPDGRGPDGARREPRPEGDRPPGGERRRGDDRPRDARPEADRSEGRPRRPETRDDEKRGEEKRDEKRDGDKPQEK